MLIAVDRTRREQEAELGHLGLVQLLVPLVQPQVDACSLPGLGHASRDDRVVSGIEPTSQGRGDAAGGGYIGAEAGERGPMAGQQVSCAAVDGDRDALPSSRGVVKQDAEGVALA